VNGGPLARVADGTLSFGEWMRNFYIPMRGANWRPATRRSNGWLPEKTDLSPARIRGAQRHHQVPGADAVQPELATAGYSYNVVYHVRDIIKAALGEAVDQGVLERNVARKTVIPEIEEREKPALPVEWYAKLLAGLRTPGDGAIFLIASFCALRPRRNLWTNLGLVPGIVISDHGHGLAGAVSGQEDQTQEPLWTQQLPLGCHP
jgi:hypothetical protein